MSDFGDLVKVITGLVHPTFTEQGGSCWLRLK